MRPNGTMAPGELREPGEQTGQMQSVGVVERRRRGWQGQSLAESLAALPGELRDLLLSWQRSLLADNKSPRTIRVYTEAVRLFGAFLAAQGMPTQPTHIRREHVEAFLVEQLTRRSAGSALTRYRGVQQWFRWLVEEGELRESPMARMRRPVCPEHAPTVLSDEQIRALLRSCEGTDLHARRDMALLRLLIDTGLRRTELASLRLADVDLDQQVLFVGSDSAKGRRERAVALGRKTVRALDAWLRARRRSGNAPLADSPWLWPGVPASTHLNAGSVYMVVQKRARLAGIEGHVYTHLFRHTFAHLYLAAGGREGHLMQIAGWRSRSMVDRYGRSAAGERARAEQRELGIGDRF